MVNGKGKIYIPLKAKSYILFESISSLKYFILNVIIFHNVTSWYVGKICTYHFPKIYLEESSLSTYEYFKIVFNYFIISIADF